MQMRRIFQILSIILLSSPVYALTEEPEPREPPYLPTVLIVESEDEIAELEKRGVIIWHRRADMLLCAVPREETRRIRARSESGFSLQRPRRMIPTMDYAREYIGAERIHTGYQLPRPYTGKGVVVGFCDTGFDPNHIAFLDEYGNSRVKRLVCYNEPEGIRLLMDRPEEIAAWKSDTEKEWHGTHVANTLAGGYRGNNYYGMAPDADIVGCTSMLYDAGILSACEDIVDYAKSVGKPAVINLSIGSYNGPHDGSSLFCRYLDLLADDAVICLSSGNEGAKEGHYRINFSSEYPTHRTRFTSRDWLQFDMVGMTDVWSNDSRPVSVRLAIYDAEYSNTYFLGEYIGNGEPFHEIISFSDIPELADIFTGEVELMGYVSPLNGRWVTEVAYDSHTVAGMESAGGKWARYELGFEFTADEGVEADLYSSQSEAWFRQWIGWKAPDLDMSVSDLCTGENTISVGMYTFRNEYPQIEGEPVTTSRTVGTVHKSSSYGILPDGRNLPHTVGPGDIMVSACNSAYIEARPDKIPSMQACTEANGKSYYWVACNGTSMSCPFTAGTIACWLEANPNLNVHDIKNVLEHTNSHDYADGSNPRNGGGWLDPYEGLKFVVSGAGVHTPGLTEVAGPLASVKGDVIDVFNPGCRCLTMEIFSMDGALVMSHENITLPVSQINISSLSSGIYILRLSLPEYVSQKPYFMKWVRS